MPTITKLFSLKETSEHNSREDCWIVVDGKVYDVTKYLDEHPGGDDVLVEVAGKDATEEFEDAGHSKSARELMQDYLVGEVEPSPVIDELKIFRKDQTSIFDYRFLDKPVQFWALPLAIVSFSVVVGFVYLRKN